MKHTTRMLLFPEDVNQHLMAASTVVTPAEALTAQQQKEQQLPTTSPLAHTTKRLKNVSSTSHAMGRNDDERLNTISRSSSATKNFLTK